MTNPVTLPEIVQIKATSIASGPPPAWALRERHLIDLMNEAAPLMVRKYTERGGALYYAEDLDDLYEQFFNWGLFYALGADDALLDLAVQEWNASTRISDGSIRHRRRHNDFRKKFTQSGHREYYGLVHPGDAEWHHKGEGNMAFYDFGLADPTISENVRRAKAFAGFYIGEDPAAPNWDPQFKILRSPAQTGEGPWHRATPEQVHSYLLGGSGLDSISWYGVRATLYPVVKDLEPDWWKDDARREEIIGLFEKIVLNCDSANNLGATALVTNAYLYTGEEKYKRWVLEYVEAWMDRMRRNNGIIPDNVGPTGQIGEHREGQWWGGIYGWNCYSGYNILFHSLTIAAECALLLSGDPGYLELLRSQVQLLLDHALPREDGQLISPARYGPHGWEHKQWNPETGILEPFRMQELAHLYPSVST